MKIGVDFDNTLANYDGLFAKLATEAGLVPDLPVWPPVEKTVLRDRLRAAEGGELEWQRLQALAYGPRLVDATLMPHAERFLRQCRAQKIEVNKSWNKSYAIQTSRRNVQALLFDPKGAAKSGPYKMFRSWNDITQACLGHELVQ